MTQVTTPKFSFNFEERVDLAFRLRPDQVRACVAKTSRKLEEFSLGRSRATGFTIDEAAVFFIGSRVIVQTGEARRSTRSLLDIAAAIVLEAGLGDLTRFVYQQRAFEGLDAEDFREGVNEVREHIEIGLGPVVVSGGTAFFYPQGSAKAAPSRDYSAQLLMASFGPKMEGLLRTKGLTPATSLALVLERAQILKPGTWRSLALGANEDTLVAQTPEGLRQYRISMRAPAMISFVEDGSSASLASAQAEMDRLLTVLAPDRHRIEILHTPTCAMPNVANGEWDVHTLGRSAARSVFFAKPLLSLVHAKRTG